MSLTIYPLSLGWLHKTRWWTNVNKANFHSYSIQWLTHELFRNGLVRHCYLFKWWLRVQTKKKYLLFKRVAVFCWHKNYGRNMYHLLKVTTATPQLSKIVNESSQKHKKMSTWTVIIIENARFHAWAHWGIIVTCQLKTISFVVSSNKKRPSQIVSMPMCELKLTLYRENWWQNVYGYDKWAAKPFIIWSINGNLKSFHFFSLSAEKLASLIATTFFSNEKPSEKSGTVKKIFILALSHIISQWNIQVAFSPLRMKIMHAKCGEESKFSASKTT